jgi:hypothetical protein
MYAVLLHLTGKIAKLALDIIKASNISCVCSLESGDIGIQLYRSASATRPKDKGAPTSRNCSIPTSPKALTVSLPISVATYSCTSDISEERNNVSGCPMMAVLIDIRRRFQIRDTSSKWTQTGRGLFRGVVRGKRG